MKAKFSDFVMCVGVLGLIIAIVWLIVGVGFVPFSRIWFGDYHAVVDILLFMLAYGSSRD